MVEQMAASLAAHWDALMADRKAESMDGSTVAYSVVPKALMLDSELVDLWDFPTAARTVVWWERH
jgi:hypothetical protein